MRLFPFVVAATLFFILIVHCQGEDLVSTFDEGLEGWTGDGGVLFYGQVDGNPDGYLAMLDNANTFMFIEAPPRFHGDLSSFRNGLISFDSRNLNGIAPDLMAGSFGLIVVTGESASASSILGGFGQPMADGIWHTYAANLQPSNWEGDLFLALENVISITVSLESLDNPIGEFNGFDNFMICQPMLIGDVNCDGAVNLLDVSPFVDVVSTGLYDAKADINQDGIVDLLDVAPFVELLSGG